VAVNLTKAEVIHLKEAVEDYKYWAMQYPETMNDQQEDTLKIALEILKGVKLYAYPND